MRKAIAALALMLAAPLWGQGPISVAERVEADGSRSLVHEVEVKADAARVWRAFTTAEGWKSWAVPVAFVDFRVGGDIETSYNPAARAGDPGNIKNRVLAYLPGRMMAFQAVQAPPGFPNPELLPSMWSVAEIEPLANGGTRVRLTGLGYARTAGHDRLFAFFKSGNATSLEWLRESLEQGPIDWAKKFDTEKKGTDK